MGRQTASADVSDSQLGPVSTFSVQAGKAKIVLSVLKVRLQNCHLCMSLLFLLLFFLCCQDFDYLEGRSKAFMIMRTCFDFRFDFVLYLTYIRKFPCIVGWH